MESQATESRRGPVPVIILGSGENCSVQYLAKGGRIVESAEPYNSNCPGLLKPAFMARREAIAQRKPRQGRWSRPLIAIPLVALFAICLIIAIPISLIAVPFVPRNR